MAIDKFTLPRPDFYDSDGRIYKDRLIENFNALESKLLELQSLAPIETPTIDFDGIVLDEVNLSDTDDTKLVSLKSLCNILGLIDMPFNILVDGLTIKSVSYYNHSYDKITVTNKKVSTSINNIALDKTNNSIVEWVPTNDSHIFLGVRIGSQILHCHSQSYCDIDPLELLGKMPVISRSMTVNRYKYGRWVTFNIGGNTNRRMAYSWFEKYGWKPSNEVFYDAGHPDYSDNYLKYFSWGSGFSEGQ